MDTTGAVIPGARLTLINTGTDMKYETVSTATGNYTIPSLPVGNYKLLVEQGGFGRYEQKNINVLVAVTLRVDVTMKVGQATEYVEVTAEASMLKTESADQSTTISASTVNSLPINFGIGAGAIRNPLSFVQLTPGATMSGWNNIRVNGSTSYRIIFEGHESSSGLDARVSDESQPSVEAIEQFTLQTSNMSAEFGQVGAGLFNFTSKSGTNEVHGSAYDMIVNEVLNAGIPFTDNGKGEHKRPSKKLHDAGVSIGGPVFIPKVYNGRNRTFFFFNYEKYRDRQNAYYGLGTVPTDTLRSGDFSKILTGRNLGNDSIGRPMMENTIYDPATTTINAAGQYIRQAFPGNLIPKNRFDPVAVKLLDTFPKPTNSNVVNNYELRSPARKIQQIPSVKIDHNVTASGRLSGYWSQQNTDKDNGQDGYPDPISIRRDQLIRSTTVRVNYDQALTPTLLLHLGAGVQRYKNPDASPASVSDYDSATLLGIKGAPGKGYPRLTGMGNATYGGMVPNADLAAQGFNQIGPVNRNLLSQVKPTAVAQVTWIHNSHTYKAGGDWKIDTFSNVSGTGLSPYYSFSNNQTAQPLYGQTLPSGTALGHGFASFLLGQYNAANISNKSAPQYRKSSLAFFLQDTWKVNRRLTLDYGVRYDLQKPMRELWRRTSSFRQDVVNPNANGRLGGVLYEGYGPGRCNCDLVETYPYAVAPRLGLAFQATPKTYLRASWGLTYAGTNSFGYIGNANSQGMGFNTVNFNSPGNNVAAGTLSDALVYTDAALYGASYNPGLLVTPGGSLNGSPATIDPNGGRPSRVNQWNIGFQRELTKNLAVEASYVGSRAAWVNNGNLISYNAVNPATLTALGIDVTKAADRTLLTSTITSPVAIARGFTKPYAGFPNTASVIQSLKPFPQFSGVSSTWSPLGNTWYDALQLKATKRMSQGLDFTASYAYSKALDSFSAQGNVFDRSTFKGLAPSDLPHILTVSVNYQVPAIGFVGANRIAKAALANWTLGGIMQYTSGQLLGTPTSGNSIGSYIPGQTDRQCRVSGEPLFLINPNSSYDPTQQTILNPKAWQDQPAGVRACQQTYYADFRGQRRPTESVSLGKRFPFRERMSFSIRVEFFNVFNRMVSLPNPSTGSPQTAPTRANGVLTGGFGFVNSTQISSNSLANTYPAPRSGQFVARFEF